MKKVLLLILASVVFFGCGKPQLEVSCRMNGFGSGSCDFTNTGTASGKLCGVVNVESSKSGDLISSPTFCSGDVDEKTTKSIDYSVPGVRDLCKDEEKSWSDVCSFSFLAGIKAL